MQTAHKWIAGALAVGVLSTGLIAFAQTGTSTEPTRVKKEKTTLNLSCVQGAVDAREGALGQAFTTFSQAMTSALSARKTALHDAWGLTDNVARRTARKTAWTTYQSAAKAARTAVRSSRETAWADFKTASKACGVPVVESPAPSNSDSISL